MSRARHTTSGARNRTAAAPPTPVPPPASRGSGTIRGRLTRILALPVVAVLVLLGVVVAGELQSYRTAQDTTASVRLALAVQDLAQELQTERGVVSGLLGGDVGFRADLPPARAKVDSQIGTLSGLAAGSGSGPAAVRAALAKLGDLAGVRSQVDTGKAQRTATFDYFTARIAALNGLELGLDQSGDAVMRRGVAALTSLGAEKEAIAQERAFLNGVFSAGGFRKGEYPQFASMYAAMQESQRQFEAAATPAEMDRLEAVQSTGAFSEAADFEARAVATPSGYLLVDPQSWWSALTTVLDDILALEQSVGTDIQHRADTLRHDATQRLAILGSLVALCILGAVALVVAAARAISRPLAILAAEAEAVATRRLPEAVSAAQTGNEDDLPEPPQPVRVPRRASVEIQSVAGALDRVQATAFALATEQALLRRNTTESLANLGRRNQSLLRRQLGFITRLESEESDPSGLANLFELDHLATRMRRNAESLLVLVGEGSPRAWASAMPMADVIRAAISEVEEYRRVNLRRVDEGFVAGAFVTGIAHMIAELVENGLTFSPPDVDVEIQGRHFGDHYLIAVTDQGIGMSPDELDRANGRLRGSEHFLMAPAKYLGHYVVGQLARQTGIDVQLGPSPVTGITARVALPARVLAVTPGIGPGGDPRPTGPMPRPARVPSVVPSTMDSQKTGPDIVTASIVEDEPASVPRQRALGVRAAPVVEYITVPGAEPPAGIRRPIVTPAAHGRAAPPVPPQTPVEAPAAPTPAAWAAAERDFPAAGPGLAARGGDGTSSGADRTRNGLTKRAPRNRTGGATQGSAAGSTVGGVVDASSGGSGFVAGDTAATQLPTVPRSGGPVDDSPERVRDRMLSLRDGFQRKEREKANDER